MTDRFVPDDPAAKPVHTVVGDGYAPWLDAAQDRWRAWLGGSGFVAKPGRVALLPGADGAPEAALAVVNAPAEPWDGAALRDALPAGVWRLEAGPLAPAEAVLGWALADYRFDRYRKPIDTPPPRLVRPEGPGVTRAERLAESVRLARDLINTPADALGPEELAGAVETTADAFGARFACTVGDDLLTANYPAIHAVGRASARAPRLADLAWGDPAAPKLTLVGKGVCFDTGGLDIKPSSNMLLMKKDMGGAAILLGLARAIMDANWPVRLRLLIPAVENAVGSRAFRPGDVLRTRRGLSVEVGNTDAEGRLVLADALAEADGEAPEVIVDAATLTGAARVALGPDLPALFTPSDRLADDLLAAGRDGFDPLWRLPLFAGYRAMIDSPVADLNNAGASPFAGAVTAALFLQSFVTATSDWAHLDVYAWNAAARPGRPKGGEATGLRALYGALERRFGLGDAAPPVAPVV